MKKIVLPLGFITASLLTSIPVLANCNDEPTHAEMLTCVSNEYKQADNELNNTYQKVMAELSSRKDNGPVSYTDKKKALLTAQRAWIKFRDADCLSWYELDLPGTMANDSKMACLIQKTQNRIDELNLFYKRI